MSLLKLTNFGGELPRVKPRGLPDGAAQRYENLLATSADLRPLAGDKTVGGAAGGALTLYRLSRNADGSLRTGDTEGWITDAADKNFVKGQLNDDATERTVVTWNDGTQAPRVIDAKGEDRLLGVPAPQQLSVTVAVQDEFTADEATVWIEDELKPALAAAVRASLVAERVSGGVPVAGARSLHGKTPDAERPWILPWVVHSSIALELGLRAPELGGYHGPGGMGWYLPLLVIPQWGRVVDRAALESRLRDMKNPKDGTQLFSDDKIEALATAIIASFDPAGDSIKAYRDKMEQAALDFTKALSFEFTDPGPRPVEPTKPSVPEWTSDEPWYGGGG